MIFTKTQIEGTKKVFHELELLMKDLGFVRWTWDYEKVVYDKKYIKGKNEYYLRVRGDVINDISLESPNALLELQKPVFCEHFFPHGLDNSVEVPEELIKEIESLLNKLEKTLG